MRQAPRVCIPMARPSIVIFNSRTEIMARQFLLNGWRETIYRWFGHKGCISMIIRCRQLGSVGFVMGKYFSYGPCGTMQVCWGVMSRRWPIYLISNRESSCAVWEVNITGGVLSGLRYETQISSCVLASLIDGGYFPASKRSHDYRRGRHVN